MANLDVVIPVFNEIEVVDQLHERVVAACQQTGLSCHIIYVDDGSRDQTARWLAENAVRTEAVESDTIAPLRVTLLRLSRNFGQPAAILAGVRHSQSDCVVILDGDLQDPPELIPEMVRKWQDGKEVVIAQRRSRRETFLRGLAFRLFHRCFRYLSDAKIPPNTGTFCLLDRRAVDALSHLNESHRFFPGLRAWVGFKQCNLLFDRQERAAGKPKQTLPRLTRYALDAIFGFSLKPLRFLTVFGVLICVASFSLASWFLFKRMVGWETASVGFTTLTFAVLGLGGFQLVGLGILGEYIGRIYDEVKNRPHFVIAEEINSDDSCSNSDETQVVDEFRRAFGMPRNPLLISRESGLLVEK